MGQAEAAATNVTPAPVRSSGRHLAAWLPVVGLFAIAGLLASGGFQSQHGPRPSAKHLVSHENIQPAPPRAAAVPAAPRQLDPTTAQHSDQPLEPVALATGPGAAGDGTIHVAASLIDSVAITTAAIELRAVDLPGTLSLTAGTAPIRDVAARQEQVASLTPAERPVPPPPVAAWRVYAQHFDATDSRPRIALIVAGIDDDMEAAIATLPPAVTLALDPYARRLPAWIELARAKGHEVLLTLSTPPIARDRREAGPMAILSSLNPAENLERLDWALARATGFVGVVDIVGNRPPAETAPILAKLGEHGLMLISSTPLNAAAHAVPVETGDAVISPNLSRHDIDRQLAALQDKARTDGHAVGIVIADGTLFRHVAAWLATLPQQSLVLAPATAMIVTAPDAGIARE